MIFATVQELEKYSPLYAYYFNKSPVLFNLVTRASLVPFQHEPFNDGRPFVMDDDEFFERTLTQIVGGKTVERLCHDLNPLQMLEFFEKHKEDLQVLGITEYWHGDVDFMLDVVRARALQWKKYQRGRLESDGSSLIKAQFGPTLRASEAEFLLSMNPYHRDYVDPVKKEDRG